MFQPRCAWGSWRLYAVERIVLACLLTAWSTVQTVEAQEDLVDKRGPQPPAVRPAVPPRDSLAWRVEPLPADNLVKNPWFRSGNKPSLEHWVPDKNWTASDKQGNPTPDDVEGTAARISTGRTDQQRGKTVDVGVETCLYQVVAADPAHTTLKFDMYWVTHTVNPCVVTVYGGPSAQGPWTEVWKPFHQVQTKSVMPKSGSRRGQDLWKDYSAKTDLATTTLARGNAHYKIEVCAHLARQERGTEDHRNLLFGRCRALIRPLVSRPVGLAGQIS